MMTSIKVPLSMDVCQVHGIQMWLRRLKDFATGGIVAFTYPENWWFLDVSPFPFGGIFRFHVSFLICVLFLLKVQDNQGDVFYLILSI